MEPTPPFCPICQGYVTEDVEVTACNHVFHRACLDGWRAYNQCPTCRQPLDSSQPVHLVQAESVIQPVLQPGDVGYQPAGDQVYQVPPNSPADPGADTAQCPACNLQRTLLAYAPGLGQPNCVVCAAVCQDNDFVFLECGHA